MAFAPRSGVGLLGVQDGDHGPSARPVEKAGLQGKSSGVRDPRPLGAGMGSSAFFRRCTKYCHDGGMAFASHYGGGYQIADGW
jgi:hypothetical protein